MKLHFNIPIREFMLKPWLYLIIVIFSLILKLITVDIRYFWRDEISTILHTSGNSSNTLNKLAPINKIKNINYYTDLLNLDEKDLSVGSQLKHIWVMPNLNPLHYYILVFWYRLVGDKEVHFRFFNIFMFFLCLPLLFLLSKQLFTSNLAGWITISLFALSPYFHYYAHEARYNMLLALILITSHYFLLKVIEQDKKKFWIGYIISGILLLYASLTAGLVLFGHFLYIMIFKKDFRKAYFLAGTLILLGYLPWILSIINHRVQITDSLAWQSGFPTDHLNPLKLLFFQLISVTRSFVAVSLIADWAHVSLMGTIQGINILQLFVSVLVLFIITYSFIYAYKKLSKEKFWFMFFITLPLMLFFYTVDMFRGSITAIIERYQLAVYLGTIIVVSFFLYQIISAGKKYAIILYFMFFGLGVTSLIILAKDEQGDSITPGLRGIVNTAEFISKAEKPLIITDGESNKLFWTKFLAFLNRCESDNIDVLYASENISEIEEMISGNGYSDVYILLLSDNLKKTLESQLKDKMIQVKNDNLIKLWKIK